MKPYRCENSDNIVTKKYSEIVITIIIRHRWITFNDWKVCKELSGARALRYVPCAHEEIEKKKIQPETKAPYQLIDRADAVTTLKSDRRIAAFRGSVIHLLLSMV